ncbi:MAG TPA: sialidase family protein [Acidimicrobiia bacterium]|nr:sialidase family protein [Acidimicrobiia bacterium]
MEKLIVGTEKGGYLVTKGRRSWEVEGPAFPGWKVSAFGKAPDGSFLAGLGSNWFGASVHRSTDYRDWQQVENGPRYPEESGLKLNQIWVFHTTGDRIYAGVDQAGLFYSDDQGLSWDPVPALNEYPGRADWQPGFGGLAAHHILSAGEQLWVGISAVGVFRSHDGGKAFERRDRGVTAVGDPDADPESVEPGRCVHGLVSDPMDPDRIWRQDHSGVYRSTDGGETWERIEEGLPAAFGFPIGRNHETGSLFVAPLTADENRVPVDGHLAVYRSQDDGKSWHQSGRGWPEGGQFNGVLRNAMAVDSQGGIAVGTTGGSIFVSDDDGDNWDQIPISLPRILAVEAA